MRTELAFIALAGAVFALCAKEAEDYAPYETKTWINEDGDTIESRYYKPFDYGEIKTVEIKEDAPAFVGTEPTEQPKPMPQKAQSAEGEKKITKIGWKKATNQLKLTLSFFTCGRSGSAGAFEIFSKFTYQFFQNTLGWYFGSIMNLVCNIEIHNYKGAIYAIKKVPEKFNDQGNKLDNTSGMTLGHFINMFSDMVPVDENGHFNPINHGTYMHEYGHYLQSQKIGNFYLFAIGIPSLLSAQFSRHHNMMPYERHANRYSANFHGLSQKEWEDAYPRFKF